MPQLGSESDRFASFRHPGDAGAGNPLSRRPEPGRRRPELRDARAHHRRGRDRPRATASRSTRPRVGCASLRELIVEKVRARNGLDCSLEQVVVTTGGCGGLFTTLLTLAEDGDEVLLPDPGWANYSPMVHAVGARAIFYPLDPAQRLRARPRAARRPRHPEDASHRPELARQPHRSGVRQRRPRRRPRDRRAPRPLADLGRVLRRARLRRRAREHRDRGRARARRDRLHVLEVLCDDGLARRLRGRALGGSRRHREGSGARGRQRLERVAEGRRGGAGRAAGLRRRDA